VRVDGVLHPRVNPFVHVRAHQAQHRALPRRRIGGRFARRAAKAIREVLTERNRAEIAGIDALLSVAAARKQLKP
jgi:hypothetical protein